MKLLLTLQSAGKFFVGYYSGSSGQLVPKTETHIDNQMQLYLFSLTITSCELRGDPLP